MGSRACVRVRVCKKRASLIMIAENNKEKKYANAGGRNLGPDAAARD